jgi:hypothetical protein
MRAHLHEADVVHSPQVDRPPWWPPIVIDVRSNAPAPHKGKRHGHETKPAEPGLVGAARRSEQALGNSDSTCAALIIAHP